MGISRRVLDGAVVHLLGIRLEVFRAVVTGETEVQQVNLLVAALSESEENVGALEVGMNVLLVMNVFEYVDLEEKKRNLSLETKTRRRQSHKLHSKSVHGVQREQPVVVEEDLPNVSSESRQHHEPMLLLINLMRAAGDESRHAQRLQTATLLELLDVLLLGAPNVEVHFHEQRTIPFRLLESW